MRRLLLLSLPLAVCVACGDARPSREPASSPSRPGRAPVIRIELPGVPDLSDIPRMIAIEALEKAGYVVERVEYRDNPIVIQALIDAKLDFASVPIAQTLAAIQKGAQITALTPGGMLSRTLVAAPDVKTCADLDGKEVAVPNLVSAQVLSVRRFFEQHCPAAKIELLVIIGVDSRLAAFVAGRVAGAILDTNSQVKLERTPNAPFTTLSVLSLDYPEVSGSTIVGSQPFIRMYPETTRDVVRELLLAIRQLQDPKALSREMQARLGLNADEADLAARMAILLRTWDMNGGMSNEMIQSNIDFAVEAGIIQPGLNPALVVDRSFAEAAVAEIGRR